MATRRSPASGIAGRADSTNKLACSSTRKLAPIAFGVGTAPARRQSSPQLNARSNANLQAFYGGRGAVWKSSSAHWALWASG